MSARIEGVIARLHGLHPRLIDLSLDRLRVLLAKLGGPERRLPPVVHVAGTNGKGSTCAFLRAIGEAAGWRVHVYTSPHLVHFNERIRIAGRLIDDATLAATLEEVERVNAGAPITVFEVITAAAFVLFAQTPAELCVLEVGLGGRGDATNVIERPVASAITSISFDHRDLLGDTIAAIASEKAGIMKAGAAVAIGEQPPDVEQVLLAEALRRGTPVGLRGRDWSIRPHAGGLRYDDAAGSLNLPLPALVGAHQHDNAAIAVAALRLSGLAIPEPAFTSGLAAAEWPARLQRLRGRLAGLVPGRDLWLDGGHNPGAGRVLAAQLDAWGGETHLVVGMKQSKDAAAFLRPLLARAASVFAVSEPGQHLALPVDAIAAAADGRARIGPRVEDALHALAREGGPGRVLICGSLYLAGEVLKLDG